MKEKNCCKTYLKETDFERCPECGNNLDFVRSGTAEQALLSAAGESDAKASFDAMNEENKMEKEMKEGFYYLYSPKEKEPVLAHGYNCTDMGGEFVFGFNTHDGGGLVPLSDLTDDTKIVPVEIAKREDLSFILQSICFTRDYVGEEMLPANKGWSWYDAGKMISEIIPDDEWSRQFLLRVSCESDAEASKRAFDGGEK